MSGDELTHESDNSARCAIVLGSETFGNREKGRYVCKSRRREDKNRETEESMVGPIKVERVIKSMVADKSVFKNSCNQRKL